MQANRKTGICVKFVTSAELSDQFWGGGELQCWVAITFLVDVILELAMVC